MKTIVIDFDGTLCHSFPLVEYLFIKVYKDFTGKEMTKEDLIPLYGPNELGIFETLVEKENARLAFYQYLKIYNDVHDEFVKDFIPGIREFLEILKEKNVDVYLLTGRTLESTCISLTRLDGWKYFKDLYYGDPKGAVKDELITNLSKDHNIDLKDILYIGDSLKDIQQCKKIGVDIISVAYDRPESFDRLNSFNPGNVVTTTEELKNRVLDLLK